jgi:hypothetical protein
VEFFLLVALMAISMVMAIPWVLAYSRKQQSAARWPRKIVTSHSAARAGGGAYRAGEIEVERVVSVEEGPPLAVARSGRAAFSTASGMFIGGVLVGAWIPVGLWLRTDSQLAMGMTAAYAMGFAVSAAWMFAAFAQFRAAWDRWDPSLADARATARSAFSAAVFAAVVSVLSVLGARAVYGLGASVVPLWFALAVLGRAWMSKRSIESNAALYAAAEANERARGERAQTGVRVSLGDEGPAAEGPREADEVEGLAAMAVENARVRPPRLR